MADYALKITIGLDGIPQVTGGLDKVDAAIDSTAAKTAAATGRMAGGMGGVESAAGRMAGGVEAATGRVTGGMSNVEAASGRMAASVHNHAKSAYMGMTELEMGVMSVTMRVMNLTMAAGLIAAPFVAAAATIKKGLDVIDDFQVTTTQIAAQMTQMQGPKDVAKHYQESVKYAGALAEKMEEVDEKSSANSKGLTAMLQVMTTQGMVLDINNKKQVTAFTDLSNAIAMVTKGQDQQMQAYQEMRSLTTGQIDHNSQLSRMLDSQIKQQGVYKGGLKEVVELGRQHGDLLERLQPYLVGINAASGDIAKQWSTAKSSLETAVDRVTREGFKEVFADIVPMVSEIATWLKSSTVLSELMNKSWLSIKGVVIPIWDVLSMIITGLDKVVAGSLSAFLSALTMSNFQIKSMWDVFSWILNGLSFAASVLFPTLIEKIIDSVRVATGLVTVAISFGSVMLEAISTVASAIGDIGKGLWAALTGDMDGMKKAFGNIFSGAVKEGFQREVTIFKGTLEALGEDWKRLKSTANMDDRLDAFFAASQAKGKTAAIAPIVGNLSVESGIDPEAQARYNKQLWDAEAALKQQYMQNNKRLEEGALKDRLAQLQYEKEMGLRTVQQYLDDRYAAEKAAYEKELVEAKQQAHERYLAYSKVSDDSGADRVMQLNAEREWAKAIDVVNQAQMRLNMTVAQKPRDDAKENLNQLKQQYSAEIALAQAIGDTVLATMHQIEADKLNRKGLDDTTKSILAQADAIKLQKAVYDAVHANDALKDRVAGLVANNPYAAQMTALEQKYKHEQDLIKRDLQFKANTAEKQKQLNEALALSEEAQTRETYELKKKYYLSGAQVFADSLDTIGQALMQGNKEQFEAGKKMAIASTIISTYLAAQQAFAALAGIPFVGPVLGAVAATAAVAAGLQRVSMIESQEYQASYAVGSKELAADQIAQVHKGEMIIDAASANVLRKYGIGISGTADNYEMVDTMKELRKAIDNNSLAVARVADGFTKIAGSLQDFSGWFADLNGVGGEKPKKNSVMDTVLHAVSVNTAAVFNIGRSLQGFTDIKAGLQTLADVFTLGFGGSVFGGGQSLTGQGIGLGYKGGLYGGQYADIRTDGGWFGSDSNRTDWSKLPTETERIIQNYIDKIQSTALNAANAMSAGTGGIYGAQLPLEKIDLRGLKPEEASKKVEEWLTKLGNAMASGVAGLDALRNPGEESYTTLIRLATALQGVNERAELMGSRMVDSSLRGADAASKLIEAMGGMDNYISKTGKFFQDFYSTEEQSRAKAEQGVRQMNVAFAEMGRAVPYTRQGFIDIVKSLDLTDESGRRAYVALMGIAESADAIYKQREDQIALDADIRMRQIRALNPAGVADLYELQVKQEKELTSAREKGLRTQELAAIQAIEYADALKQASSIISESAQKLIDVTKTALSELLDVQTAALNAIKSIMTGPLSGLSPEAAYRQAQAQFAGADNKSLPGAATALLEASRNYNASGVAYQADLKMVLDRLGVVAGLGSNPTLDLANEQLKKLEEIRKAISDGNIDQLTNLQGILTKNSELYTALTNYLNATATATTPPVIPSTVTPERFRTVAWAETGYPLALKMHLGLLAPDLQYDVDKNGVVNMNDALQLMSMAKGLTPLPSYDVGTPFVPEDMTARIHRSEMVIDPTSAGILRKYGIQVQSPSNDNREMVSALDRIEKRLESLENHAAAGVRVSQDGLSRIAENTAASKDSLNNMENKAVFAEAA